MSLKTSIVLVVLYCVISFITARKSYHVKQEYRRQKLLRVGAKEEDEAEGWNDFINLVTVPFERGYCRKAEDGLDKFCINGNVSWVFDPIYFN